MKGLTIVITAVVLMITSITQGQVSSAQMGGKEKGDHEVLQVKETTKLYGEMTVFELNGRTVVKVAFDKTMMRLGADKDISITAASIQDHQFLTLGEALNVLSTNGWNVDFVWTTLERSGTVQHFLITNEVPKLLASSPWADKSGGSRGKKVDKSSNRRN